MPDETFSVGSPTWAQVQDEIEKMNADLQDQIAVQQLRFDEIRVLLEQLEAFRRENPEQSPVSVREQQIIDEISDAALYEQVKEEQRQITDLVSILVDEDDS